MDEQYWFKKKRFGYGWYPATWQGWLVMVAYVLALIGITLRFHLPDEAAYFTCSTVLLTLLLVYIAYRTGEKY